MIDLHCHILPGLDDGASSWREALDMARAAAADGIEGIVCTPHWMPGVFENMRDNVLRVLSEFKKKLAENEVDIEIYPGSELRLDLRLGRLLEAGKLLTLNDGRCYALIELPESQIPETLDDFFWELKSRGFNVILGHPERNIFLHKDPMRFFHWVQRGVLVQITAASLLGHFGKTVREFSVLLLEHNLVHVIATDAHGLHVRSPNLSEAVAVTAEIIGEENAARMVIDNPRQIIDAQPLVSQEPVPIRNHRSFFYYFRRALRWR